MARKRIHKENHDFIVDTVRELHARGYTTFEISIILERTERDIIHWKAKAGIGGVRGTPRRVSPKVALALCEVINEEHPITPLTDQQMVIKLKARGISVTSPVITGMRNRLNIPAGGSRKEKLTRKYLYFIHGRITWRPDKNHTYIKTGKSIYGKKGNQISQNKQVV